MPMLTGISADPHTPHGSRTPRRRLRVLHVGKYYPPVPGGMERVLQLLCEREREHVDCSVLVAGTDRVTRRDTVNGVSVTRAGSLAMMGSVGLSPALPWILRQTPADVTVIHEPNPVALVADLVTRRRGALVVYFHSEVVRPAWKYRMFYRPFLARVLQRSARILVASPAMKDTAIQLEAFRDKCEVVPYGIEIDRLSPPPAVTARAAEIRDRYPGPIVLFVGRLVPYKGASVLLEAVSGIAVTTILVGGGPLAASLRDQGAGVAPPARVVFAGEVDDQELLALYHACDVFVLPSVTRAEAFGMVQLEAMACGKPVISTDLPSGVPWVNRAGETGLVVPPGDALGLRSAIVCLVSDAALRRQFGAAARSRVEAEFTAERMAARTVAVYRSVLGSEAVAFA